LKKNLTPRSHQTQALTAWIEKGSRGVVSLPTGAGKTILAVMAIAKIGRPTVIVVPTIDLLHQWRETLESYFDVEVGALGGGLKDIKPVTVATYDSALIFIEKIGNQFGFMVVDECHHLPADHYQNIAFAAIAPFRLGLSATIARADGKHSVLWDLLGELAFESQISEMVEKVLAPYDVVSIPVKLSSAEREAYQAARQIYTGFLRRYGVNFSAPGGWRDFIMKAARLPGGREAMAAYREQKRLAQAAGAKMDYLWKLLRQHQNDRMIIFTDNNELAYHIGRLFILPVLTHQTKLVERKSILDEFRSGEVTALVTSKVLNEGVDVPEASVAVVVSGSGAVREHVQRLGRILRQQPGKRAVLYELIADQTSELNVNRRRREHDAYQGSFEM
jgi:superfamily II DNA or RNA helicase